ncbi:MAG: polymer-forming cytoskeletal protein [Alphaproteobacteria bacterium]|nr:polymer-forming cytoskeletal protein [Alphaproteobacteria bacterium]
MFHRVKSEPQENTNSSASASNAATQASEFASAETARKPYPSAASVAHAPYAAQKEKPAEESRADEAPQTPASGATQASTSSYASRTPSRPYGSGYAAAAPAAPQAQTFAATAPRSAISDLPESDRRLIIGKGITMSGQIESCEQLIVEGTVEAALKGASTLEIAESGTFYGTVDINEATVAGRFEGELTVNGRLTIRSTGVITGTIAYRELEVEAGAVIDGRITPLNLAGAEGRKPLTGKKDMPSPKVRSGGSSPMEGELFSGKAAAE